MRKFGLALCAVLALGVSASAYDYYEDESELPRWKTSLGIMGGVSKTEVEISRINADIGLGAFTYGISGKSEWKLGGSNFYAGMYADYIQTENLVDENLSLGEKLRLQSVGAAFTLGYSFNKNISTNVYIGGAANKFISVMDWEASPLYGLSVDYTYGYFTHGIMARYLDLSVGNIDASNTALMYRIGLSF